jgi:ParB-like chromosome segregation protein Spo0J
MENLNQTQNLEVSFINEDGSIKPLDRIQKTWKIPFERLEIEIPTNPREVYGTVEQNDALRDSLRLYGQLQPIYVKSIGNGKYKVTHGFRRTLRMMELVASGHEIPYIEAYIDKSDDIDILAKHVVLNNTQLPFNDIELTNILLQLQNQGKSTSEIAKMTSLPYQKVYNLITLGKEGSEELIEAIKNDEISITAAIDFVKLNKTKAEQNQKLAILRENKEETKSKKIKVKDIKEPKPQIEYKEEVHVEKSKTNEKPEIKDGYAEALGCALEVIYDKIPEFQKLDNKTKEILTHSDTMLLVLKEMLTYDYCIKTF